MEQERVVKTYCRDVFEPLHGFADLVIKDLSSLNINFVCLTRNCEGLGFIRVMQIHKGKNTVCLPIKLLCDLDKTVLFLHIHIFQSF